MKDSVSFETAKRLKEAGFPDRVNGFWFLGEELYHNAPKSTVADFDSRGKAVFAPTATDILREIFAELEATGKFYWIHLSPLGNIWEVSILGARERLSHGFIHENPAEAAALAYEWVKNQKNV